MAKPPMLKKCEKCPLVDKNQFVPVERPLQEPTLIVIAEAPGQTEVQKRRPLIGQAGSRFRRDLNKVGGNHLRCVLMNTVNCRPPQNSKPTAPMIRRCRQYVDSVLDEYPDLPILLLGDVAGRSFIVKDERFQITKDRGYAYDTNANRPGFLTFHPSFINRCYHYDPIAVQVWEHDLQRAWDWGVGNFRYQDEYDYRCSVNHHDIIDYCVQTRDLLAVDIETSGLDPRSDTITGIAFCHTPNDSIAVPWPITQNETYLAIKEVLENPKVHKVFQNGLFDVQFLTVAGIHTEGWTFDTRYAHHCTLPDGSKYLRPHSLKFMNSIYTNLPPYKAEYTEVYGGTGNVDVDTIQELACHDTNATLQIARCLRKEHDLLELNEYFATVLMPTMSVINDMHVRGVRIAVERLKTLQEVLKPKLKEIEKSFIGVNLNSPKQVGDHLTDIGVQLTKKTPTGNLKVDAATLQELLDREENQEHANDIEMLLKYHDLKKMEGTYCTGLLKRLHTGRLHTSFSIGPSTGRFASSDPNLQNIPEEIREYFIPDENMKWVKADYTQVELFVAALEYQDEDLLGHLRSGVDVHDTLQRRAFGDQYVASDKRQRRIAKTVVFGTLYGRGARAIAVAFGVSVERAKRWQDALFETYPAIREGQQKQAREAKKSGIIRSKFGNIRQTREYTKIVNHPIQGGAAGILCIALKNVGDRLRTLQPLITVHDEIDFQVPTEHLAEHKRLITDCMSAPIAQFDHFQFPIDIDVGESWAIH